MSKFNKVFFVKLVVANLVLNYYLDLTILFYFFDIVAKNSSAIIRKREYSKILNFDNPNL